MTPGQKCGCNTRTLGSPAGFQPQGAGMGGVLQTEANDHAQPEPPWRVSPGTRYRSRPRETPWPAQSFPTEGRYCTRCHPQPAGGRRLDPSVAVEADGHVAILAEGRHLAPAGVQVQHPAFTLCSVKWMPRRFKSSVAAAQ